MIYGIKRKRVVYTCAFSGAMIRGCTTRAKLFSWSLHSGPAGPDVFSSSACFLARSQFIFPDVSCCFLLSTLSLPIIRLLPAPPSSMPPLTPTFAPMEHLHCLFVFLLPVEYRPSSHQPCPQSPPFVPSPFLRTWATYIWVFVSTFEPYCSMGHTVLH